MSRITDNIVMNGELTNYVNILWTSSSVNIKPNEWDHKIMINIFYVPPNFSSETGYRAYKYLKNKMLCNINKLSATPGQESNRTLVWLKFISISAWNYTSNVTWSKLLTYITSHTYTDCFNTKVYNSSIIYKVILIYLK